MRTLIRQPTQIDEPTQARDRSPTRRTSGTLSPTRQAGVPRWAQPRLKVGPSDHPLEREADQAADQVVRGSLAGPLTRAIPDATLRKCDACEEDDREEDSEHVVAKRDGISAGADTSPRGQGGSLGTGKPLDPSTQRFMEHGFGHDFGDVRVHDHSGADAAAQSVQALAYTTGTDVVFRRGAYDPATTGGIRLLAHELAHVVQQRGSGERGEEATRSSLVQRFPGDGMMPPGDCDWSTYLQTRLSVEATKALVSTLGAMLGPCGVGPSGKKCELLALKIAAITAEIAARVALATACFRGGDTGHRQQIQGKVNMLIRCYRFFNNGKCSQGLVEMMESVVVAATAVIAVAMTAAGIALVIAALAVLVMAIMALAEMIAAAVAAAAESALVVTAVAELIGIVAALGRALQPSM